MYLHTGAAQHWLNRTYPGITMGQGGVRLGWIPAALQASQADRVTQPARRHGWGWSAT